MSIMRKDERALDLHQICHLSPQVCGRFLHPAEVGAQSGKWKSHNIGSEQHNTTMHNHMQSEGSSYRMYTRLHLQGPDQGDLGKTTKHYVKWYNLAKLCTSSWCNKRKHLWASRSNKKRWSRHEQTKHTQPPNQALSEAIWMNSKFIFVLASLRHCF